MKNIKNKSYWVSCLPNKYSSVSKEAPDRAHFKKISDSFKCDLPWVNSFTSLGAALFQSLCFFWYVDILIRPSKKVLYFSEAFLSNVKLPITFVYSLHNEFLHSVKGIWLWSSSDLFERYELEQGFFFIPTDEQVLKEIGWLELST